MREEYVKELKDLKRKMIGAEKFANALPLFANTILKEKANYTDDFLNFGNRYKSLYLAWGIKRFKFSPESDREILNLIQPIKKTIYLFNIYVNCYNLFGDDVYYTQARNNLDELEVNVFFYDNLNSTFYATDKQIENLLEKLNDWYIEHSELIKKESNKKKIEEMKRELEKLEKGE